MSTMLKKLHVVSKAFSAFNNRTSIFKRTFLSEAYRCEEAWERRLESPILQKLSPEALFFQLKRQLDETEKISAVDVDIFANILKSKAYNEELLVLLQKLRLTVEATNILNSTHHAVIRYLLDHDHIDDLHRVLLNRFEFGIFPDHASYNLLIDTFIKRKDFASAVKVATLLMVQEDSDNAISNALCIYSCHKYLENPDEWQLEPEPPENDDGEEVKVRVAYLRNPFFDDHFDLKNPRDLVGKTLVFQGKRMNDSLGRSCYLRGLILYKKYKAAGELIKHWTDQGLKEVVYGEIFDLIENDNSYIAEDLITDEFKEVKAQLSLLKKSGLLHKGSVAEEMENRIKAAVEEFSERDISSQCQVYIDWEKMRATVLKNQLAEIDRRKRLAKIPEIKKDLEERELMLTFFDKEEEIELQIEKKLEKENKMEERYKNRKVLKQELDDAYIPPEVGRPRSENL